MKTLEQIYFCLALKMTSTLTFNKNTKLKMGVANLLKELEMSTPKIQMKSLDQRIKEVKREMGKDYLTNVYPRAVALLQARQGEKKSSETDMV